MKKLGMQILVIKKVGLIGAIQLNRQISSIRGATVYSLGPLIGRGSSDCAVVKKSKITEYVQNTGKYVQFSCPKCRGRMILQFPFSEKGLLPVTRVTIYPIAPRTALISPVAWA